MALKALRCPQCGADIELDDSKEFGFCSSCGTKIMLHEVTEVRHSGEVKMTVDNSAQAKSRFSLADRAFDAGNWGEAYNYYTKGLEDIPDDMLAVARKGICAIYLSSSDNLRIPELKTNLDYYIQIMNEENDKLLEGVEDEEEKDKMIDKYNDEHFDIFDSVDENLKALINAVETNNSDEWYNKVADMDVYNNQARRWCEVAKLYQTAYPAVLIDNDIEEVLKSGVSFCDRMLARKVELYTNTTTNKKGEQTHHYKPVAMSEQYKRQLQSCRAALADAYNNLAGRVAHKKELEDASTEIQKRADDLKAVMENAEHAYEAAKAEFWSNNGELEAQKTKKQKMTWISAGVGLLIWIITFLLKSNGAGLPLLGGLIFAGSIVLRFALNKKIGLDFDKQVFPENLKALESALTAATGDYNSVLKELSESRVAIDNFKATDL